METALAVLGSFSAFQYNTTVKRAGSFTTAKRSFSAFQYNTTVKLNYLS